MNEMRYTALGRTGLKVSVAGLGGGGFSRLGLSYGASTEDAESVVRTALDLGINYIDTAESYETEPVIGRAIRGYDRAKLVIASKCFMHDGDALLPASAIIDAVDRSLKALGTDYIDIYQIHGPRPHMFDHLVTVALPALERAKEAGKIRHVGLTEAGVDHNHEVLLRAADLPSVHVMLFAFHMMHLTARNALLPKIEEQRIGGVCMYAVRNIFARLEVLRQTFARLADEGSVPRAMAQRDNPLDFLLEDGGARSLTEAAYRFAAHEPGVDVVVFGTGNRDHVRANAASIVAPPLSEEARAKITELFSHLAGVGLEKTPRKLAIEREAAEKTASR